MASASNTKKSAGSGSLASKKRKTIVISDDEEEDEVAAAAANASLADIPTSSPKRSARKKHEHQEKRAKVFRKKAPITYLERLSRVRTQRMFLIDRARSWSGDGQHEEERIDIAGSTGNIYQVTISKTPSCTCPDSAKGNQCKHIIYIMVNVLKVRENFAYQLAFLTSELATIFSEAPSMPQSSIDGVITGTYNSGNRKPIEGDCPVCVMEFVPESDEIVWCKAACGNNIHRQCFERWAASKPGQVKCVYCRTVWKEDEESIKTITKTGKMNREGYINVAAELGISGERDMSSYHQPWVRSQEYRFGGHYR